MARKRKRAKKAHRKGHARKSRLKRRYGHSAFGGGQLTMNVSGVLTLDPQPLEQAIEEAVEAAVVEEVPEAIAEAAPEIADRIEEAIS